MTLTETFAIAVALISTYGALLLNARAEREEMRYIPDGNTTCPECGRHLGQMHFPNCPYPDRVISRTHGPCGCCEGNGTHPIPACMAQNPTLTAVIGPTNALPCFACLGTGALENEKA